MFKFLFPAGQQEQEELADSECSRSNKTSKTSNTKLLRRAATTTTTSSTPSRCSSSSSNNSSIIRSSTTTATSRRSPSISNSGNKSRNIKASLEFLAPLSLGGSSSWSTTASINPPLVYPPNCSISSVTGPHRTYALPPATTVTSTTTPTSSVSLSQPTIPARTQSITTSSSPKRLADPSSSHSMFINTSLPCTLADSPTSTPRISARLPSSIDSSSSPLLISSSSSSNSNTTLQELSFSESVQSSQTRPSISPDGLFSYPSLTRLSKSKNSTNHRKNSSTSGDGRGDDDHRQHPSHPHHVNTSQTKSRSELFTKLTSAHQLEELGSKCRKAVQAYTHLPTPQQDTVNELLKFAINKTTEFCSVVGGVGTESRAKAFLAGAFGNDLVPGYYSLVDNNNNNSSSGGGGNSNCDEENYITSTSQGGASSRLLTINGVEDSDDIHSILSRLSELDDSVISDIEEVEEEEEVGKVGEEEDDSDDIQRMLSRLSVFNDNAHIEDEDYKEEKGGEDVEMLKSNEDIMEKMVALGATVSAVSSSFSDNIFPSRSSSLSSASSNSPLDEGFASSSSKSPIPISSLSAAKEEQANSTNFKDATIQDIPVAAIEMQQEEGGNPRSGVLADRYFRQRSPERFTNSSRSSSRSSLALHTNTSSSSGTGSNGSASSSTTSSPGNRCTRQSRPPILNFESLSRHRVSRLQTSPEGASTILMNNDPTGIKRSDSTPPNHQLPMNDLASDSVSLASTSGGSLPRRARAASNRKLSKSYRYGRHKYLSIELDNKLDILAKALHNAYLQSEKTGSILITDGSSPTSPPSSLSTNHRSTAKIASRVQSVQFIEMMGEISTSLHQKFTSMLSLLTDEDGESSGGNDEAHLDFFNSIFPDWYVGDVLGSGAMGVVYAGTDPETQETLFAIKKSKSGKLLMNKMVYQAIIKVFRLMNHPNIIQYYGCEVVEDDFYMFMEYCNEGSVFDKIYKSPQNAGIQDVNLVQQYTKQTLQALVYLHRHDIVHRDLKPGNLLVKNGVLKLADFGASKLWYKCCDKPHHHHHQTTLAGGGGSDADSNGASLSAKNNVKNRHHHKVDGSPCYLSPEVVASAYENVATKGARDVWAVGCCLYEMVLGRPPWAQIDNIWSLYYVLGSWHDHAKSLLANASNPNATPSLQPVDMYTGRLDELKKMVCNGEEDVSLLLDIDCIKSSTRISHPLIDSAILSERFTPSQLDFLNLTLQWTPEQRPSAASLLEHAFIKDDLCSSPTIAAILHNYYTQ